MAENWTAYAEGIRREVAEDRGPWQGLTETCRGCQRATLEHLEDGYCWQCNHPGEPTGPTPERRLEVKRELYRSTAEFLRRAGYPDRAAWYEDKLDAMGEA